MAPPPVTPIEVQQLSTHLIPNWAWIVIFLVIFFILYHRISHIMRQRMLAASKNSAQKSVVKKFINVLRIALVAIILLLIIFTYTESFTALGISAGVIGVVLGWILQKPIEGMAAFFLIVTRKPFRVGDRIELDGMKGDVVDITMTHLYLDEVGGTISSTDKSGRVLVIPTNILFDKKIINYSMNHEYMLDEIITTFTYDTDIDRAMEICLAAANKVAGTFSLDTKTEPFCRVKFAPNGIEVFTRYQTLVRNPQPVATDLTKEIYRRIKKDKRVELAFPTTEVLLKKAK